MCAINNSVILRQLIFIVNLAALLLTSSKAVSQQFNSGIIQNKPIYKNGQFIFPGNSVIRLADFTNKANKQKNTSAVVNTVSNAYRPGRGEVITGNQIVLYIIATDASCGYANGSIIVQATNGVAPYSFSMDGGPEQLTGNFPSGLLTGDHLLKVTDAAGNTVTTSVTLKNTLPGPVQVSFNFTYPFNCTSNDGKIEILPSGGTPPYYYSLDQVNWQTSNVFDSMYPGIYTFLVKDANDCGWYSINQFFFSNVNCDDAAAGGSYSYSECTGNGTLTLSGLGANGPYTYSLDGINFQASDSFDSLGYGVHSLYIKNSIGTVQIISINIIHSCFLILDYIAVDAACTTNNGIITVNCSNGVPPYQYTVDGINYQASNIFTGMAAGNYYVTARDAAGTLSSLYCTVYDRCPVVTGISTGESCSKKDGTIVAGGFKGTAPYQFSIDGINFQTSYTFTGLSSGNYTVTIKDALGFTSDTTVAVANACLPFTVVNTSPFCGKNNGTLTVDITAGTAPYQFSIDGLNYQPSNSFQGLAPGSYTITVKDATGQTAMKDIVLVAVIVPVANAVATAAGCDGTGGSITISITGGTAPFQYSLDSVNYQASNVFSNRNEGLYRVMVKDSNNCIAADTITVFKNPTPLVSIGNDTSVCVGQTVLLQAPAGSQYKYQWQDNNTANNYTVTSTGQYWLKVTNQFNCAAADTISVVIKPLPIFSLGNDTSICTGKSLNLAVTLSSVNYLWSTGSTLPNLLITGPGLYWLKVSDGGCSKTDTINVAYKPSPIADIGNDTTLCAIKNLQLQAGNSGSAYLWQDNSMANNYTVNSTGQYWVKVTNQFNCVATDTINIVFKPLPVFSLGNDTSICTGKSLNLAVVLTGASYLWNTGSNSSSLSVNSPGLFWLKVTDGGCSKSDSIIVTYKPSPIVNLGKDSTLCEGQILQLHAGNPGTTYLWQDNSTAADFQVSKEGMYFVSVNKAGCIVSDTINVAYKLKPRFSLGPDQLICQGQSIILQPSNNENWQLRWQDGSSKSSIQITQPGLYGLTATNTCGTNSDEVLFTKGLCKVYVPNAFSPNGDTRNDVFKVSGTDMLTEFHLQIFNRYGQIVFDTQDKNKGWNGSFNNKPAVNGNYVYLLQYKESGSTEIRIVKGNCLLIR